MCYYLFIVLNVLWFINSFIVIGEDFFFSYNIFGKESMGYFYVRCFYLRYEIYFGKIELGVIFIYKGRVFFIGLLKDGWIIGVCYVK